MKPAAAPHGRVVVVAWLATAAMVTMAAAGAGSGPTVAGAAIVAIAAVGVDVCVGSAGLRVSSPAFMLVGGLASALVARHSGLAPTAATLVGLVAGLAAGAILGDGRGRIRARAGFRASAWRS